MVLVEASCVVLELGAHAGGIIRSGRDSRRRQDRCLLVLVASPCARCVRPLLANNKATCAFAEPLSDFSARVGWEEQTSPSCQSQACVLAGPGLACSFMCTLAPSPASLLCVTTHGLLLSFVYVPKVVPVTQVTTEMLYRML